MKVEEIRKRTVWLALVCQIALLIVVVWLFAVQTVGWKPWHFQTNDYPTAATRQQWQAVIPDPARPIYMDRNGDAIGNYSGTAETGVRLPEWLERVPAVCRPEAVRLIEGTNYEFRSSIGQSRLASQLIGLSDSAGAGITGLEKTLDRLVRPPAEALPLMTWTMQATSLPCEVHFRLPSKKTAASRYPMTVMTTLDADVQRASEEVLDHLRIAEGAIVVLDAANADVLAMAGKPEWTADANTWQHQALETAAPGSVFKLVSWLAAAEKANQVPGGTVFCPGHGEREQGIRCHAWEGHGRTDSLRALIESCNRWFTAEAEQMPAGLLESMAERLGIIQLSGNGWFDGEQKGRIHLQAGHRLTGPAEMARTMIGQQDVRITPLAAANLMVTILHSGKGFQPRVVKQVLWNHGISRETYPVEPVERRIFLKRDVWSALRFALRETAAHGTAKELNRLPAGLRPAGKTGTVTQVNPAKVDHWFAGYFPEARPVYAFAVLVKNVPADSPSVAVKATHELILKINENRQGKTAYSIRAHFIQRMKSVK